MLLRILGSLLFLCFASTQAWNPHSEADRLQRSEKVSDPDSSEVVSLPPSPAEVKSSTSEKKMIRVLLGELVSSGEIRFVGRWNLLDVSVDTGMWKFSMKRNRIEFKSTKKPNKIILDTSIWLSPQDSQSYFIHKKRSYRGQVRLLSQKNGVAVLNIVELEDYLRGVVPGEIGRKLDPVLFDAVRAQAIVARTYTLRSLGQYGKEWDLRDDVRDQVYEGRGGEDPLCNRAVAETATLVLRDSAGAFADTYYHSGSGGHTANVANIWPTRKAQPYLRGVVDTTPEGVTWNVARFTVQWTERWPIDSLHNQVERNLSEALGKNIQSGKVDSLKIVGVDLSGRNQKLVVYAKNGEFSVPTDRIRWVLRRPNANRGILRSAKFQLSKTDQEYIAEGSGNGHGVGLSQTGAMGRAQAGQSFQMILQQYYPGTVLGHW